MFRRSRPAPAVLAVLSALLLAAPVAAQSGPSAQREAAENALADAQALAEGENVRTGRELTTALLELRRERSALSRSDKDDADRLLARPTDANDGGVGGPYAGSARVMRTCSFNFCVHWVDSTADAPPQAKNSCASPAFVDKVITALEQSYIVENTTLDWRPPLSDGTRGGDFRTDVYLKDLNDETGGLYGYAATEGGSGSTRPAYMVLENDFAEPAFDDYNGDPTIPIEATAAHEYNHVLQYAYDIGQDDWMYESTATWAEEKVFPDSPDWHGYIDDWAAQPNKPLTSPSGLKMYGSAIWNHWLEQRYGADVVRRAWEQSVASGGLAPKAYDLAIKAETAATSFEANFGDFASATAEWTAANSGIRDGTQFTDVVARENPLVPLIPGDSGATTINHTGFRLFDVDTTGSDPLELTASLRKAPGNGAAGTIALVGIGPSGVTKVVARTDTTGANATVTLDDPARFTRITAVIANADKRTAAPKTATTDWFWSRDSEPATFSVAQDSDATPSPEEPAEPLDPDPAGTPPDTTCATTTVERGPAVVSPTTTPTPSATPSVSVTPTTTPTVQPPVATSVRLSRNSTRISSVLRKGVLSLFAQANKAGRHSVRATVDAATAKRLKVGRRTTTAGTGSRTASAPARLKVNVKLTRKLRAALKRNRKRSLKVKVAVTFTPADGTAAVRQTLRVRLKP